MSAATISDLNGLYKQVYPEGIENAVPGATHLLKALKFTPRELQNGLYYNQPIILAQEQGWTYLQAGGSTSLNGSTNMALQNAQVLGNIITGQSQLTVEAAERARAKGPSAFRDAIGLQMEVMMDSGKKRQEFNFLYGQTTVALVASNTHLSATQTQLVIVASEWSAGFWAGMQNARFDAYFSDGATKINTSASLNVATSNAAQTSVTFNGASADITAVEAACAGNTTSNQVQLYFFGSVGNESPGVKGILTNAGTLYGINAANFDLWNGTQYSVAAPGTFSFSQLQKAIGKAVSKGLAEDVTVYVNPDTWTNLMTDQAALRMYPNASSKFENGADELTFYGQNGKVTVVPHIFVKSGDAFALPLSRVKRIGVREMSFNIPGTEKGTVFIQLQTNLAFEYRCYAQECIFIETPARAVYVSGIVN